MMEPVVFRKKKLSSGILQAGHGEASLGVVVPLAVVRLLPELVLLLEGRLLPVGLLALSLWVCRALGCYNWWCRCLWGWC